MTHAAHSAPVEREADETAGAALALLPNPTAAAPEVNPDLVAEYQTLLAQRDGKEQPVWSQRKIADRIGIAASALSNWAAQLKPEGERPECRHDIAKIEARLEEFIRRIGEERPAAGSLMETAVTRHFAATANLVNASRDIGLYHGPAGIGKTCAARQYAAANPLAKLITACAWISGKDAVRQALWRAFSTRTWKPGMGSQATWLADRIQKTSTTLIVDNAHRLSLGALAYLFDLHDATQCPIMLVGNPEVLDKIRTSDQLTSRIGMSREARMSRDALATAVEFVLEREMPGTSAELRSAALQIAERKGCLRSLTKHLALVREVQQMTQSKGQPLTNLLKTAHGYLVSEDFSLD